MFNQLGLRNVEAVGIISWLLKDTGWVLLFPPLAWLGAAFALVVELLGICLRWRSEGAALRVHSLAVFLWLLGNAWWMISEFGWDHTDANGRRFPWFSRPAFVPGSQEILEMHLGVVRGFFGLGLAALALLYAKCAVDWLRGGAAVATAEPAPGAREGEDPARRARPLVWGLMTQEVYVCIFIGPWLLKDFLWTFDLFWGAFAWGLVVMALIADYMRIDKWLYTSEMCWVVGNMIWLIGEVPLKDAYHWPRIVAASVLLLGLGVQLILWLWPGRPEEQPLLGKQP